MWQDIVTIAPAGLIGALLGFALAWQREQRHARRARRESDAMMAKVTGDLLGSSDDQVQRLRADLESMHLAATRRDQDIVQRDRQIEQVKRDNTKLRGRNAELGLLVARYQKSAARSEALLQALVVENVELRLKSSGVEAAPDRQVNEIGSSEGRAVSEG